MYFVPYIGHTLTSLFLSLSVILLSPHKMFEHGFQHLANQNKNNTCKEIFKTMLQRPQSNIALVLQWEYNGTYCPFSPFLQLSTPPEKPASVSVSQSSRANFRGLHKGMQ